MPITALETGLYNILKSNADLITELGGTVIYNKRAPQSPGNKYVIFQWQGGGDENLSAHRTRNVLYSIFGVAPTQEQAAGINDKIDAALHGQTVTVSGYTNFWTRRETDVNFVENDSGGVARFHVGGIYRIRIDGG